MSQKGKYLKILNAKGMAKNVNRIKKVSKKIKRCFSRFSKTISLTRNLTAERSFFFYLRASLESACFHQIKKGSVR